MLVSPEDLSVSDLPGVSHHSIVLQADGNGVLYSSFTQAQSGQSVMVKATAGVNYRFNRWLVESGNVQLQNASSAETSFVMGNEGVLLRAVFDALPTYGLLISDDGHGYGVADIDSAADLVTVSITAYPNPYFTFKEWVVVQGIVTNVDPHRTHTSFTMPAEFVELRATFNRFTRCDEAGMGTLSEPYVIYFEEQMADLANQVNGGRDMSGVYFSLQEDISLGNYTDWQAIGDSTGNAFRGEFDGNGFTISDVTIAPPRETPWNNSEPDCYIGLFGCIDGGSVKNVSVQGTLLPQQLDRKSVV